MDTFDSVEALGEANKAIGLDIEYFQLKSAVFKAGFDIATSNSISVVNESHSTALQVFGTSGQADFFIPINATPKSPIYFNGREMGDTHLDIVSPNTEFHASATGAFRAPQISIPSEKLITSVATRSKTGKDLAATNFDDIQLNPEQHRYLVRSIESSVDTEMLYEFFVNLLVSALQSIENRTTNAKKGRPRKNNIAILNRAIDFIREHNDQPISVESICLVCGCSQKTLERIFIQYLAIPPKKYINCYKLHVAHKTLLRSHIDSTTVQNVAIDCGFTHIGRFSNYYHSLFREYPLETLRKSPTSLIYFKL